MIQAIANDRSQSLINKSLVLGLTAVFIAKHRVNTPPLGAFLCFLGAVNLIV